jgi:hypothetical protein
VFSVGAVQDSVADLVPLGGTGAGLTRIVNDVIEVLMLADLAVIVMCPVVPSSLTRGVPLIAPLLVSKASHAGSPDMPKVTPTLLGDTVGWNEYVVPTVALGGGAPFNAITVEVVGDAVVMRPDTDAPLPAVVLVLSVEEELPCVPEQPPIITTTISHSASRTLAVNNSRPRISRSSLRSAHSMQE